MRDVIPHRQTIFSLGYENHSVDEILNMLLVRGVEIFIDIRSYAQSEQNPVFSQHNIRTAVENHKMIYHWAGKQLGGLRKEDTNSKHHALMDSNLRAFADYMETHVFHQAARQLMRMANKQILAIMGAEEQPEHCHRSLIADFLLLQGYCVEHLVYPDTVTGHLLRPELRRESAELIYDRQK